LHGLVADRVDPGIDQRSGAFRRGRQMQVGEQDLALAHPVVLSRRRFLHLEHHLGNGPHVVGLRHDAGTCGQVSVVGKCATDPGTAFHEHLMPAPGQLHHPGRR
jgi:hypothetical protein